MEYWASYLKICGAMIDRLPTSARPARGGREAPAPWGGGTGTARALHALRFHLLPLGFSGHRLYANRGPREVHA